MATCRCFFFSSRRRHTRSKRDWSSDVCSSDLGSLTRQGSNRPDGRCRRAWRRARSEERRVGKECRSRRAPYHQKKKKENECVKDNGASTYTAISGDTVRSDDLPPRAHYTHDDS